MIQRNDENSVWTRELTADREQRAAILDAMKELRYVERYEEFAYSGGLTEDHEYTLCVTEPPGSSSTKYLHISDMVAYQDSFHCRANFENTGPPVQALDDCFAGEI